AGDIGRSLRADVGAIPFDELILPDIEVDTPDRLIGRFGVGCDVESGEPCLANTAREMRSSGSKNGGAIGPVLIQGLAVLRGRLVGWAGCCRKAAIKLDCDLKRLILRGTPGNKAPVSRIRRQTAIAKHRSTNDFVELHIGCKRADR